MMILKQKDLKTAKIESLKKGDYFKRKETAHEIYSRQNFCRSLKKFEGQAESDINKYIYLKKGTEVFINFEY